MCIGAGGSAYTGASTSCQPRARRRERPGSRALALALPVGAASRGSVPKALAGSYETYFPTRNPHVQGHWAIAVGHLGSFVWTTPLATLLAIGPVSVNGNTIAFRPDAGRGGFDCSGPGIYSWSLAGKTLRFTKVDDGCVQRAFRLTAHPWTRFTSYKPVIIIQH